MGNKKTKHKIIYQNKEDKRNYIKRLAIIEGQIRGISQMIKENRYCSDILIQISSAEKSLKSLSNNIIENHLKTWVCKGIKKNDYEIIDEFMDMIKQNK